MSQLAQKPSADVVFKKGPATGNWLVVLEGVVVGAVQRRETVLSNLGKSKHALNTRGVLWQASAVESPLAQEDARAVERHLSRQKTTRAKAAECLLAAYEEAGIALPKPAQEPAQEEGGAGRTA